MTSAPNRGVVGKCQAGSVTHDPPPMLWSTETLLSSPFCCAAGSYPAADSLAVESFPELGKVLDRLHNHDAGQA